jgi:hypothetical protein
VNHVDSRCRRADERNGGGRRMEGSRSKWNARMSVARSVEAGFSPWIRNCRYLMGICCRKHQNEEQIVTTDLTYFARLANAATFADQASAEVRRRGVERAKEVCAIQDGAEWIQGFVQSHRHDALRMLDFARAASYVSEMADQVREGGGHLPAKWVDGVLHRLLP